MIEQSTASLFATRAHGKQRRKYTDEPYVIHVFNVAKLLKSVGASAPVITAGLLHDTIEDVSLLDLAKAASEISDKIIVDEWPDTDDPDVRRERGLVIITTVFGQRVSDLVEMVTDISKKADGNRKIRKLIDTEHLAKADADGQTIKLADLIDNAPSIIEHDPGFAVIWMREKRELLPLLSKGNPLLFQQAQKIINDFWEKPGKGLPKSRNVQRDPYTGYRLPDGGKKDDYR